MKTTLAILFALFSLQVQAQAFEMTCNYQYETYTSVGEVTASFTVIGYEDNSGVITFSKTVNDLPAYFYPSDRYGAYWHNDSSIIFNAQLSGTTLRYSFLFNNYISDTSQLKTVFNETRVLDMTEHFEEEELDFDYDDGKVTNSKINKDDWVNESHIQIDDCEILYLK